MAVAMRAAVVAVAHPAEVADTAGAAARLEATVVADSAAADITAVAAIQAPTPDAAPRQACLQPAALAPLGLGLGKAVAVATALPAGISSRGISQTPADPAQ